MSFAIYSSTTTLDTTQILTDGQTINVGGTTYRIDSSAVATKESNDTTTLGATTNAMWYHIGYLNELSPAANTSAYATPTNVLKVKDNGQVELWNRDNSDTMVINNSTYGSSTYSTAMGFDAGNGSGIGSYGHVFFGGSAGAGATTTGFGMTALGNRALKDSNGSWNTCVGMSSGRDLTGNANTFVGLASGQRVGGEAGSSIGNTGLGYFAGWLTNPNSDYNTLIGYQAGRSASIGSNNTIIGSNMQYNSDETFSDTVVIGSHGNERMRINSDGNMGVATTEPEARLHVVSETDDNTSEIFKFVTPEETNPDQITMNGAGRVQIKSSNELPFVISRANGNGVLHFRNDANEGSITYFGNGTARWGEGVIQNGSSNFEYHFGYSSDGVNDLPSMTSSLVLKPNGGIKLNSYTSVASHIDTPVANLAVNGDGEVITTLVANTQLARTNATFDANGEFTISLPSTALYGVGGVSVESTSAEFVVIKSYTMGSSVTFKLYDHTGTAVTSTTRQIHYSYTI